MGTRFPLRRAGAVLAVASAALMLAAVPASAADPVKGRWLEKEGTRGVGVRVSPSWVTEPVLSKFRLSDGTKLDVYCVEIHIGATGDRDMVEVPWDKHPKDTFHKNSGKINWVLHNSVPRKDLKDLQALPGLGDLDEAEAIGATQAAIWHFSDGINVVESDPTPHKPEAAKDVLALYKHLIGSAADIAPKPAPELKISPESAKGAAGELIGPFKVATNGPVAEIVESLPEGVTITDKDGKEIAAKDIKDGAELFLKVPADAKAGDGSFVLKGMSKVEIGRLFMVEGYAKDPAQSLIVADSSELKVEATAKGEWKAAPVTTTTPTTSPETTTPTTTVVPTTTTVAPTPQGSDLPDTGASILVPALVGLGLVGAGAGALIYQRRRRSA